MLKIRLRRAGKRHQPTYRVVVVEHTAPAQGSYLEAVGTYNPRASQFAVNQDRVLHWLNNGAQPSERIAKLLSANGVKHKLIVLPDYSRKPKKQAKKAAPEAPKAAVAAEATPTEEPAAEAAEPAQPDEQPAGETPETTEGGSNPEAATEAASAEETPVETQE